MKFKIFIFIFLFIIFLLPGCSSLGIESDVIGEVREELGLEKEDMRDIFRFLIKTFMDMKKDGNHDDGKIIYSEGRELKAKCGKIEQKEEKSIFFDKKSFLAQCTANIKKKEKSKK